MADAPGVPRLPFGEVGVRACINNATLDHYFPAQEAFSHDVVDSLREKLKTQPGENPPQPGNRGFALPEIKNRMPLPVQDRTIV